MQKPNTRISAPPPPNYRACCGPAVEIMIALILATTLISKKLDSVLKCHILGYDLTALGYIGRNLCPIFVQFRCPRSPTTFSPYDSMDFYMLNSNFNVVTSKNLQFFCNLRSKIDLFSVGNFMLFTIIVLVQVS